MNKKRVKKSKSTMAIHVGTKDSSLHVVGLGNLRVMICHDDDSWFAQALEIDYAVQGNSLEEVKRLFGDGLLHTIHENLRVWGHIQKLLKPAPAEVWKEFFEGASVLRRRYSQESIHNLPPLRESISVKAKIEGLPFDNIEFIQPREQQLAFSGNGA